ncbi:hypothetical protein PEL8287_02133 [Roseovarius litorisediminis]|uniref:Uncharacterized protein n=1 Tax=Roseovarius litorisediminis TaxID=1312363 RepID=A0A1Y5SKE8_9RHOB|nr:hypothetical protein [Roseovarius litorisediminis]SLN42851.1 hypothetical protein PEL8287_02133 [Roseovarius litorisediminis]
MIDSYHFKAVGDLDIDLADAMPEQDDMPDQDDRDDHCGNWDVDEFNFEIDRYPVQL